MDTYIYRQLQTDGSVKVDRDKEMYKINVLDDYKVDESDTYDITINNICTLQQLEMFYKTLIMDLYRRDRNVEFEGLKDVEKKYYIVPLKRIRHSEGQLRYEIDRKLIEKVEKLCLNGYRNVQQNIIEWTKLKYKKTKNEKYLEDRLLSKWMLVSENKPNSCYTYVNLLKDLKNMSAYDMAVALKCKPEELGCETA